MLKQLATKDTRGRIKYLVDRIKKASHAYYNTGDNAVIDGKTITDDIFDSWVDELRDIDPHNPQLTRVGSPTAHARKTKLPFPMASLNKYRPGQGELAEWKRKYPGPWMISDKLDGASIQPVYGDEFYEAFTRGDGRYGQDISFMLDHFRMPEYCPYSALRGEVIMSKSKFAAEWSEAFKNARNMASGLLNRKDAHPASKDIDVVLYQVLDPIGVPSKQLAKLKAAGFKVVWHTVVDDFDEASLSKLLKERKAKSPYEMDGIVVCQDRKNAPTIGNPPYAFAFKDPEMMEGATTEVIKVHWTASKDGLLKPRIQIKPVKLAGVTVNYATGHNAYFIQNGHLKSEPSKPYRPIGPGAIITLIRSGDVIPYVTGVEKGVKHWQEPDEDWEWTASEVDAVLVDHASDNGVLVKRIASFFRTMGVEFLSEASFAKVVGEGYETVESILKMTLTDWKTIPGFKDTLANKAYSQVQACKTNVYLPSLADASGFFGRGFGTKRFEMILDYDASLMSWAGDCTVRELAEWAEEIPGFSTTTASQFAEGMPKFLKWIRNKGFTFAKPTKQKVTGKAFAGESVTFTGFRSELLERFILQQSGAVISFGAKTTLLVYGGKSSTKVQKARDRGIRVMSVDEFWAWVKKLGYSERGV